MAPRRTGALASVVAALGCVAFCHFASVLDVFVPSGAGLGAGRAAAQRSALRAESVIAPETATEGPATLDADLDALVDVKVLDAHSGSADPGFVAFRQNFLGSSEEVSTRQNFGETPEDLLNLQVQMELGASHAYSAMAAFFDRADVALPGFKAWAEEQSKEEREHAEKFIEYINLRGGTYVPLSIPEPAVSSWSSALDAMRSALRMELEVNLALLRLHASADEAVDPQMCDFIESEFLTEQVESINAIAKVVRQLVRAGPGLGEYEVDKTMGDGA